MAQQTINIGSVANDGTGDPLRTAFTKVNSNFDEVYIDISNLDTELTALSNTVTTNAANAFDGDYDSLTNKPNLDLYVLKNNANTDVNITARSINLTSTDDVQNLAADEIRLYANTRVVVETEGTGNSYFWIFNSDGGAIFPDGFIQETAFTGTQQNITEWNTAYGWGDHNAVGYLTEIPDIITSSIYSLSNTVIIDSNTSVGNFEDITTVKLTSKVDEFLEIYTDSSVANTNPLLHTRFRQSSVIFPNGVAEFFTPLKFTNDVTFEPEFLSLMNIRYVLANVHIEESFVDFEDATIDFSGANVIGLSVDSITTPEILSSNNLSVSASGNITFDSTGLINFNNDVNSDNTTGGFTTDKALLSIKGADFLNGSDNGGGITIVAGNAQNGGNNGDVIISSGSGGLTGTGAVSIISDGILALSTPNTMRLAGGTVDFYSSDIIGWNDPNVVNEHGGGAIIVVAGQTATMDDLTVRITENTPGELDVEFNYDPSSGTVAVSANGDVANRFNGTTTFAAGNTTWTAMNTLTTIGDKGEMTIVDHSYHKIYRVTTFARALPGGGDAGDAYCVIERLK